MLICKINDNIAEIEIIESLKIKVKQLENKIKNLCTENSLLNNILEINYQLDLNLWCVVISQIQMLILRS